MSTARAGQRRAEPRRTRAAADPRPASLDLVGLTRRYGALTAVDGLHLDLALAPGTVTALLGPSGCGKSTTLSMVAGLTHPDAGDVLLDGRSLAGVPAERRPVDLVFQRPLLFPHLSVAANVAFGLRMRRTPRAETRRRVADMLDRVGLTGLAERRVGELSGGQEQRAALARALVLAPRVLLLDEPFSALDPELRERMRRLVRDLHDASGLTTVLVTHDRAEALAVADRIALLVDGRLAGHDRPEAFFARPPSLVAARFFGVTNELAGTVAAGVFTAAEPDVRVRAAIPDGPAVLVVRPERVTLAAADGGGSPGRATDAVEVRVVVGGVRFAGTHLVVEAVTAGGRALTAHVPTDRAVPVGGAASARFDEAAMSVFPWPG